MKVIFIFILFSQNFSYAQFEKKEKMLGGNINIFITKEKNGSIGGGGPLGNVYAKETAIKFMPEFTYIFAKNSSLSLLAGYVSDFTTASNFKSKSKGYLIGIALSKHHFVTNRFSIFGRLQISYSPTKINLSDADGNTDKTNHFLTNIGIYPGFAFRFSKHFSMNAIIGRISYDHLTNKQDGQNETRTIDEFNFGFTNISFGAFYIFK